ncbi:MAG: hypothetical protein KAI81_10115, partial [Candidatus Marinimicrobia bacterium]|nr:hypothetical protein [Candidatus Neomarinimicrobiota bacterium]
MLKQTTKVDYNLSDLNTQSGREKKSRSTDTSFSEFLPYIQTSLETKIPMSETKLRSDFNRSAVDEKIRVSERDGRYKRQTSA